MVKNSIYEARKRADDSVETNKRLLRSDEIGMPFVRLYTAISFLNTAQVVPYEEEAVSHIESAKALILDVMDRMAKP